ncbi:hypothetical protein [Variovorax boronicumulans]
MTITAREPDAISYRGLHGLMQAIQTSTHFLSALILSACVLAIPVGVHAQVNPEIANCAELKDEATITQADLCSAHIGCRFVLNVQKTCARAKGYLERLQTAIGEGTRTFFGSYRKEVTPDAVFTAVLNGEDRENERKLGGLAEHQRLSQEIGARVREVGNGDTLSGKGSAGTSWAYYGQVKDGQADGHGTFIFSDGEIQRGRFSGNQMHGPGDVLYAPFNSRYVGELANNQRAGQGLYIFSNGATKAGTWGKNKSFQGAYLRADGSRFEGTMNDNVRVQGREYRTDGTQAEEGRYESGKLSVGTQYDMAGVRTEVNLPALARKEQTERIALELARSAAEIEAEKQRKREEAARAEQQFRSSLQTMNPGQLFARADELNTQGDKTRAREVQRALTSRFPNHPLAATAARQIAGESSTSSETSSNAASAAGTRATVATRGEPSVEMLISRCSETLKTTIDVEYREEIVRDRYFRRNHTGSRERTQRSTTQAATEYATGALAIPPNSLAAYHAGALQEAEIRIKPMQNGLHDTHREQALLRACLIKARIDSGAVTAGPADSGRLSGAQCQAMKQSVMTTKVPPNASVTASTETVMFMTKTVLDMIAGGCPTDSSTPAQIEAERQERQRQYTAAESACNAVQSGGRRCVPRVHTAAEASRPTVSSAAQNTQQQGAISYDPVTGRCLGEGCCSLPGITGQPQCSSSSRSSGGGIRTAR